MEQNQLKQLLKQNQIIQRDVYYAHCDRLMSVVMRYVKQTSDAEEVLQDAFYNIFKKIKQFDSKKGSFESWSYKIAINQSLMFLRKKNKLNIVDDDMSRVESKISNDGLEELHFEDLLKKIDLLDEKYRTILTLKLIEGYEYKEISNLLKIQESSIRKIFSRARHKLIHIIETNDNPHLNPISEKINL